MLRNWFEVLNYLFCVILYNLICDYLNIFDDLFCWCTLQNSYLLNFFNVSNFLSLLNLLTLLSLLYSFRRRLQFFDNFLYNWTLNLILWSFLKNFNITNQSLFLFSIWLWITIVWSLPDKDFLSIFSFANLFSNYSF